MMGVPDGWWLLAATLAAVASWPRPWTGQAPDREPQRVSVVAPPHVPGRGERVSRVWVPDRRCRWRWRRRSRGPAPTEVADRLLLLSLALRSGLGLTEALEEVVRCTHGPLRDDLAAVVAALRWGRSTSQSWAFAGPVWRPVAQAMQLAEDTGAAPADLVTETAARLREQHDLDLEGRAARAGVMLVLPLGLAFLPALACTAVVPVVIALARGFLSR